MGHGADSRPMNSSEIFNHGYIAGYNQALVDRGHMSQKEADKILLKCEWIK